VARVVNGDYSLVRPVVQLVAMSWGWWALVGLFKLSFLPSLQLCIGLG
jgi:hypothetical protein